MSDLTFFGGLIVILIISLFVLISLMEPSSYLWAIINAILNKKKADRMRRLREELDEVGMADMEDEISNFYEEVLPELRDRLTVLEKKKK